MSTQADDPPFKGELTIIWEQEKREILTRLELLEKQIVERNPTDMPKVPIIATVPQHGEANWSAKPTMPQTTSASDTELQMLGYLRRIVDSLEHISLSTLNITTQLAKHQPPAPTPSSSVSD